MNSEELLVRLTAIRDRVTVAAEKSGRNGEEVTVIAVTKTHPATTVAHLYGTGVTDLGENRIQEASTKIDELGHDPWRWHLIGSLQSNKAAQAVRMFDVVHSVDTLKLARRLDRVLADDPERGPMRILLQVNVADEASKSGFDLRGPGDGERWERFLGVVREIAALPNLVPCGLMTVAPLVDDPEQVRPCFRALARIRDALREHVPDRDWRELSMGMSNDFEIAVEEGATLVRIGRAILGARS
ncbi:YggS family pyridoxal phosphate-dependent enzyme [Streptosporangium sp. NPDC000239]|uniref:Pyridoxal phosphate homeostasis protein n=1 Tax=Streptosporangium jomthongense TaxID=1193683 RepID=A0ABV8FB25_9ACTN